MERAHERAQFDTGKTAIDLDGLHNQDQISVQTASSRYQFSVEDPSTRKGTLSGGRIGEHGVEAVFTGSVSEDKDSFDARRLRTGSRAVFFVIESTNKVRRVITSVITDIAIVNGSLGGRYAA